MQSNAPIKTLPFSLRAPAVSRPVYKHSDNADPFRTSPPPAIIDLTTLPDPPVARATPSAPASTPTFHELLAELPPAAPSAQYIEACPRRRFPDARRPFKLGLKLSTSSSRRQSAHAQRVIIAPREPVPRYEHQVHTDSNFYTSHYAHGLASGSSHKTTPLTMAELGSGYEPEPSRTSRRPLPAYASRAAYSSKMEEYERGHSMGYLCLADLDPHAGDDADEAEVDESLYGSELEDPDFDPDSDEYSSGAESSSEASTAAAVAGGVGYLAGSCVKVVLVAANSVVGWWSGRNTTRS